MAGIVPGLCRLVVTYLLAQHLSDNGIRVMAEELTQHAEGAPPAFASAISAQLVAILLLSLRPIAGITVDLLIALQVGGLDGTLAGIIANSVLKDALITSLPAWLLAPLSGALMSMATVLDHLPHGSFFYATGGSVNMAVHERLKLLPYETLVGFTIAAVSALMFGVFNLAG